jgi:hypothetical protein
LFVISSLLSSLHHYIRVSSFVCCRALHHRASHAWSIFTPFVRSCSVPFFCSCPLPRL